MRVFIANVLVLASCGTFIAAGWMVSQRVGLVVVGVVCLIGSGIAIYPGKKK